MNGLLALARAQHGVPLPDTEPVPLDALAAATLTGRAAAAAAAAAKELVVYGAEEPVVDGARVRGSRTLLTRMVENLVDNAIVHNEPGGWLRVATGVEDTDVRLVVENGGPRLAGDQLAGLTHPFRGLGAERTGNGAGTGLGLSIVTAVADAHAGAVTLEARPEGGLRVTVTLPRAREGAAAA